MRYIIASDIHGSAHWCERLLTRFEELHADRLILLGDILYHGPRNDLPDGYAPKQVIAMLDPLADRIICVRGNCEAEVDQMVRLCDTRTSLAPRQPAAARRRRYIPLRSHPRPDGRGAFGGRQGSALH